MKHLPSWFNITEQEYMWYILQGYTISYDRKYNYVVWSMDGKQHRIDGPAVIWAYGKPLIQNKSKVNV